HRRAHLDDAFDVLSFDDRGVADEFLEQKDAALDEALLILGVVVLGVLIDIAEFFGLPDPFGNLWPALAAQDFQLPLEPVESFLREIDNLVAFHPSPFLELVTGSQSRRIIRDPPAELSRTLY